MVHLTGFAPRHQPALTLRKERTSHQPIVVKENSLDIGSAYLAARQTLLNFRSARPPSGADEQQEIARRSDGQKCGHRVSRHIGGTRQIDYDRVKLFEGEFERVSDELNVGSHGDPGIGQIDTKIFALFLKAQGSKIRNVFDGRLYAVAQIRCAGIDEQYTAIEFAITPSLSLIHI